MSVIGDLLRRAYLSGLRHGLRRLPRPRHIALVMDGNRRWARQQGFDNPSVGHAHGADHVDTLLGWCNRYGIDEVTIFVCSTENLHRRPAEEVDFLLGAMERVVTERAARPGNRWKIELMGRLDVLPDGTRHALKRAAEATADVTGGRLALAIGYGGRQEIVDAVRELLWDERRAGGNLSELAGRVEVADLASRLYAPTMSGVDLIIRTSGELRLSNFLLWQSAGAEFSFCDTLWPGFRELDFVRALRDFGRRRVRQLES
ncbi:polyprenyl diphosphate synthase [Microlunatus sp. GCM10028923]|uniref:polyprenyl diphosphate synthase n=1 Tax=Microlunatus sp. GCM10028923 TaxID=3273400 RepID=UPI0036177A39